MAVSTQALRAWSVTRPCLSWLLRFFVFIVVCAARPLLAHDVPFSYVDIDLQPAHLQVTVVAHILDLAHDLNVASPERLLDPAFLEAEAPAIAALLRARLHLEADGRTLALDSATPEALAERQSVRLTFRVPVDVLPGRVGVNAAMFPYDPVHQTFVNVYESGTLMSQMVLDRGHQRVDYFAGTPQGVAAVFRKFVPAGIHHILIGPDHLLFLVGLLLLGGSLRQLLVVVSAFTVAHSVTLSLAALNILSPPARIIEPAIALSIVCVGADNLMAGRGRDVRAWIAFGFGFIHGFGFANVLREMDLPVRALGWSLLSFNIGVELGQLLVVVAVATAFAVLRARSDWAGRQLAFAGSLAVIAAGTFWFVQRVFFVAGVS